MSSDKSTYKNVVILGGGMSGVGAAVLAVKNGYTVFLSDGSAIKDEYKKLLEDHAISFEECSHTLVRILKADVVIKSPGIPDHISLIKTIKDAGIPVISELEWASQLDQSTQIAITGSNGKTTATSLLGHIAQTAQLNHTVGGNIGESYAMQVASHSSKYRILEVSSFQLDGITSFAPHIAVLLNITPDHLDRYDDKFENYIASKLRITSHQTSADYLIYNADDEAITTALKDIKTSAQLIPFSLKAEVKLGSYIQDGSIIIKLNNSTTFTMPINQLSLKGSHNTANAMAAATTAKLLQIRNETIRQSLQSFQGVEHRLEQVLKINKVQYINDSKATNTNATYYALESMEKPTVWIVGGVDKGNDYSELYQLVQHKVKAIICLGLDNSKLVDAFSRCVEDMVETESMTDAVRIAYKLASAGDNVLLSPACASFDLFENYEDRGRQFKNAVRQL